MEFQWPSSSAELARLQKVRKRAVFERAKRAPFYRGKLNGIDAEHLDDPEVWARIPVTTKDDLRGIPPAEFHEQFCVAPQSMVWRS